MEEQTTTVKQLSPEGILQVGMGFWASKTLLTAVNLELFSHLALCPLSAEEIRSKLNLHPRALYDFLDALVALKFLDRQGFKDEAFYSNTEETNVFLDKNKPSYIGGILEMANNRLYGFWGDLEEGLKTGKPQNETKTGGKPLFEAVYSDPQKLTEFLKAMGGLQMGNFVKLSNQFDFSKYSTICDIGGAGAYFSAQIASDHSHLSCISYDLPEVTAIATENVRKQGLEDRVSLISADFFTDNFPKADVITMGNILHDWGTDDKIILIQKAYVALPKGGALVVIENIIDNDRSQNAFGLMMSLNMLIETSEGYDFSEADFTEWATEIGFRQVYSMPLTGPSSAVIAIK